MPAKANVGYKWLHRLIYLVAALAIVHFGWMKAGKHDFAQPLLFGAIVGAPLLARVYWKLTWDRDQRRRLDSKPA